jgi:hypothetical protein
VEGHTSHAPPRKEATYVNRLVLAAAACALPLLAGCSGPYSDAAQQLEPLSVRPSTTTAGPTEPLARPDDHRVVVDGLAITRSAPKSFTPTDSAYPRAQRAVAFELIIVNEDTDDYQPSQLSITATVRGAAAPQVVDSTQGYTGLVGADAVRPGQSLRIAIAFAVPTERADVRLLVAPRAMDGARVTLYTGTV